MAGRKGSYDVVTLRETNVDHVANLTGHSKTDLREMLDKAKDRGEYEVRIPVGVKLFTREER